MRIKTSYANFANQPINYYTNQPIDYLTNRLLPIRIVQSHILSDRLHQKYEEFR